MRQREKDRFVRRDLPQLQRLLYDRGASRMSHDHRHVHRGKIAHDDREQLLKHSLEALLCVATGEAVCAKVEGHNRRTPLLD
jgi:hypothetical protein